MLCCLHSVTTDPLETDSTSNHQVKSKIDINLRINRELVKTNSRGRLTVSLKYRKLEEVARNGASPRF
jgi:hypothetical protein